MKIRFTKMNGAGNDFILIDNRTGNARLTKNQMARLCDRHYGVGADGILFVESIRGGTATKRGGFVQFANGESANYRMRYYNADGGEADMCGNGARCFAKFVRSLGWKKDGVRFLTKAGIVSAHYQGKLVEVALGDPKDLRLDFSVFLSAGKTELHFVNTGVPHAILFVKKVAWVAVPSLGGEIRRHRAFGSKGTNANFVEVIGKNKIAVRTFERGVEGETLACGTGVVAAAIIAHLKKGVERPVRVHTRGGSTLRVDFKVEGKKVSDVRLTGPAEATFSGHVSLK